MTRRAVNGAIAFLLLVTIAGNAGCSWLFLDAAPKRTTQRDATCAESSSLPAADLTAFFLLLLGGLVGAGLLAIDGDPAPTAGYLFGGMIATGGAFGASGVYGGYETTRCLRLHGRFVTRP